MSREDIIAAQQKSLAHLKSIFGDDSETVIAGERYGFISGLLRDVLKKPVKEKITTSDKIDRVLVHRIWGIPIFLGIMYGVFQFVFNAAAPLTSLIEAGFTRLAEMTVAVSPAWWSSLLSGGIIGGVGSVLGFVPNIFFLFIAISILEDCGYLSRSACRTRENPRDRLTTMLVSPFIACGARLPIFVLLAGAFFPARAGLVIFLMYVIGIAVAVITALIFRKTLFRGPSGHFVMELPPYRFPTFTGVMVHMWERGRHFLKRAGTVIFAVVIIVWLLGSMPWGVPYASAQSWLGHLGSFLAPVFIPCGFGQWQAAASLAFGFLAKETVVGSMGAIFSVKGGLLGGALMVQLGWSSLIAFVFMVFTLLYTPCIAAIGTLRSETGSWKWPWFSIAYTTGIAWVAATVIYQIGRVFTGG